MERSQMNNPERQEQGKYTKLEVISALIGGHHVFEIYYQNRRLIGTFPDGIWGNKKAMIREAKKLIDQAHQVEPFKTL
ncbi:hypothetical protein E7Z59_13695 [Robertkochia marina]|uniref:Uncharacterized protein n=1 Tax=Robertkochia marina TaxID=1227945 RepID=A0A4S3LZF7_9FLAO|nr:hypothetical protein [Robertkochia marina]THD66826.1 hypothetical protein E7Z59_13695 [Robertkochia marina]TRZ40893.1 hypothetical protein D3A96_14825 [Robertkochia marina]